MRQRRRRLLLIAFHFPPLQGSSGVHRALGFGRYLPQFGWDVTLLTAHSRAYAEVDEANKNLIPASLRVLRAQAWDAARHLSIRGHYPGWLARPDRWISWVPFAIRAALQEYRERPFDAVLSTFPIASAHLIGDVVRRRCGLPWLAEFRDPMASEAYPIDKRLRRNWAQIQQSAVIGSARVIVTTSGTARFYRSLYPIATESKVIEIANGFEPQMLQRQLSTPPISRDKNSLLLLHSGTLYPRQRNPEPLFRALGDLKLRGIIDRDKLQLRFRASAHDDHYTPMVAAYGLQDIITFAPTIPYLDASAEMCAADALLILQARNCNDQIPAKVYEYLYAGRPIIALADPIGDTGTLLAGLGIPGIAALEDEHAITSMLTSQLPRLRNGNYPVPPRPSIMFLSRESGARELARQLDILADAQAVRTMSH